MNSNDTKLDRSTAEKDTTHVVLGETHDIGANLYLEAEQLTPEELETEGAEVLKILDWRIMPMVINHSVFLVRTSSDSLLCSSST